MVFEDRFSVNSTLNIGPFVNWWLNKRFKELLDRGQLCHDVTVDPLNLVGIHELETMAESAEGGI